MEIRAVVFTATANIHSNPVVPSIHSAMHGMKREWCVCECRGTCPRESGVVIRHARRRALRQGFVIKASGDRRQHK